MADFFSLDDELTECDEDASSLHRNCLKELALEQMQSTDDSDAASDISEDLPEGTDWHSLPVAHRKHDRDVNEEPPLITPRELDDRPRSARTAAGVRFAAAEQIFENRPSEISDFARPRTAALRGADAEHKEAKMFTFNAEGLMNDWKTSAVHAIDGTSDVPDAFPTPKAVRKAIEARSRPPVVAPVPPLNLSAIKPASSKRSLDPPSSRPALSSARSSLFTPRNSERRQRQRELDANGQDFLDSYRQDLVAVFMGSSSRRVTKAPPKKKGAKKQPLSVAAVDVPAHDNPRALEPSLGSTLRSTERDTHAYTASPVAAAAAESSSSPQPADNDSVVAQSSSAHSSVHSDAFCPRSASPPADTSRLRAGGINVIEQAALSGIEEFDSVLEAEERITSIVKRAQTASSPGKKGTHAAADDAAPLASAPSQKAHMLSYLQSGRRPRPAPRAGASDFGEADWQLLYNESDGRALTELMAFDLNNGVDSDNKGRLLCKLLQVPKACTAQVLRAAASVQGVVILDNCRQLLCSAFQKVLEREALLQLIHIKQATGAPTYADIVCLGRLSAVVAVKLKELRRSMFWIGHSRCFVWGKQEYEKKMAHDMEEVQLRF